MAAEIFDAPPRAPLLLRLRDAYLEPWQTFADAETLRRMVPDAIQLGKVGRALHWERTLAEATPEQLAEFRDGSQAWLNELDRPIPV
ncbi:MAG: hypothetical protein IRY92_12935 [Dactylosporangium sp.]|nr:hypothetical protein [Dactylosporangium sp.]